MTTHEIRRCFLEYFEGKGHHRVPSGSLIPDESDPSVLLTIAGMQPLKAFFMGTAAPPAVRMTSSQKCFRTLDIDQVGRTARHLTFFEMLGNFSIGDYFKTEAIRFGYEVSTEVFGFDPADIWITVFEGMPGVPADDEAVEHWMDLGFPRERIQALGDPDNFWKVGPTGPCGPNTELYIDRGPAYGPPGGPASGSDRYLEFWNLVFMQYNRSADATLTELPAQNIDTGAGLERIAAIIQGKDSVFDTDAFAPLIAWGTEVSGRAYGKNDRDDRSLRVLADHGRSMTFLATDGVRPGNEGRDYVLRRIIRRAVSEARQLGLEPEIVGALADQVIAGWGDVYPELSTERGAVTEILQEEAEQFARTIEQGQRQLKSVIGASAATGISGEDAFRLYDTFGFPLDLTLDAAEEAGLAVDTEGFDSQMDAQRTRARAAAKGANDDGRARAEALRSAAPQTVFVGYDQLDVRTTVTAVDDLGGGIHLVKLAESPFYAQGGGQVSDTGTVESTSGSGRVADVYRIGDDQVLRVVGTGTVSVGDTITATVDPVREVIAANHTATHLLNWALREYLGDHIRQAGSYVGPDKLRFDFTQRDRLGADTKAGIEAFVRAQIAAGNPVTVSSMARTDADASGAVGIFEEKYGEVVRVVDAGSGSRELCGGTHVANTSEIGDFAIVAEAGIGSGTRRIEALTGAAVAEWTAAQDAERAAQAAARQRRDDEAEARQLQATSVDPGALAASAETIGPVRFVAQEVQVGHMEDLMGISDRVKVAAGANAVVVLAARHGDRAMLVVSLGVEAVAAGWSAGDIVKTAAPLMGGGGGGKPGLARAGGKDPEGIPDALAAAERYARERAG